MTDEELDRLIDQSLAGRPHEVTDVATSVVVSRLVTGYRAAVPPGLTERVGDAIVRAEYQRALPVRLAALVVAVLFALEGLGNIFNGEWVARNLDVPFDSHASYESGVALLVLALVVGVGALRTKWLDAAVLAGVPAGLLLAASGVTEFGEFPEGGLLHSSQGLAALALGFVWWRYARRRK